MGVYNWQVQRSSDGGSTWADIGGASGSFTETPPFTENVVYTYTNADDGDLLRLQVVTPEGATIYSNDVGPIPTPPPPPPPPGAQPFGTYLDPSANSVNYSAEWDAALAAMPNLDFAMAPLDSSFITHVGNKGQWCLVPAGMTASGFTQFGLPCWLTGLVDGFVVVDEPGSDPTSLALINTIATYVRSICGSSAHPTNAKGLTVQTSVTQFDPGTLTALANANLVDLLFIDNYPSRSGWNLVQWNQCVAACQQAQSAGKIKGFWIVLDAFEAPGYPAPTEAQLLQQISLSQASGAQALVAYAWGVTGGTPLAQLPGLVAALNTIP